MTSFFFPLPLSIDRHIQILETKLDVRLEETNNLLRDVLNGTNSNSNNQQHRNSDSASGGGGGVRTTFSTSRSTGLYGLLGKRPRLYHQKETITTSQDVEAGGGRSGHPVRDEGSQEEERGGTEMEEEEHQPYSFGSCGDDIDERMALKEELLPSGTSGTGISSRSPARRVFNIASRFIAGRSKHKSSRQSAHEQQPLQQSSQRGSGQGSPKEYSELTMTLDYEELKSSTFSTDEEDTARDAGSLRLNILTPTTSNLNRARSLQLPTEPSDTSEGRERGVLRQVHSDSKDTDYGDSFGGGGPTTSDSNV